MLPYRGLECKSRKSRNIWSNRKIWPWNMEWSRARLTEFGQDKALFIGFSRQEYWSGLPFPSPVDWRTNTHKICPFHHRGLECKSRKSRDTWSNRQICHWSTKWSREKANRVLSRECTGHSKHPPPTTQETILHMDITRWPTLISNWLYSLQPKMEKLCTVSKNKIRTWLWLRSWTHCQIQT